MRRSSRHRHRHHHGHAPLGRPRSPHVDRAILDAALHLLRDYGYKGMSLESVASYAGVGKAAIYRRYRDKADLVAAALADLRDPAPVPDTGEARKELAILVRRVRRTIDAAGLGTLGTLLSEEDENPALLERFRERVIAPGRAIGREVLERAGARGELREGADIELALDLLAGSYLARHLAGVPVPRDWAERVAEAVWRSVADA